jgi:hypothetical protein
MTLWHGRLSGGTADVVMDYSVSLDFDRRLAHDDLVGSRAHVRGLGRGGLLVGDEVAVLLDTLDRVEAELDDGSFVFEPGDEDIHTAVERRVTELAGDVGAKLHTGRSRNDQIATDLRLYAKRELAAVAAQILELQDVLVARAKEADDVYLPGYTHLQRAQPVLLAHHLLAHGWALARDVDRLVATVVRRPHWPARRCPSTPTARLPISGSRRGSRTRWMPCPTVTSWPRPCSTWHSSACTYHASARSWCCGPPRSSASPSSTTHSPPAARCFPRRRTPMSPSWPGARAAASSAI